MSGPAAALRELGHRVERASRPAGALRLPDRGRVRQPALQIRRYPAPNPRMRDLCSARANAAEGRLSANRYSSGHCQHRGRQLWPSTAREATYPGPGWSSRSDHREASHEFSAVANSAAGSPGATDTSKR